MISHTDVDEISISLKGWGLATLVDINSMICGSSNTIYFAAPELLSNNGGAHSDIWSIGMLTYFFL